MAAPLPHPLLISLLGLHLGPGDLFRVRLLRILSTLGA